MNKFSKLKTAYVSSVSQPTSPSSSSMSFQGGLTIVNRNTDYGSGPVAVYIVAEHACNFRIIF